MKIIRLKGKIVSLITRGERKKKNRLTMARLLLWSGTASKRDVDRLNRDSAATRYLALLHTHTRTPTRAHTHMLEHILIFKVSG